MPLLAIGLAMTFVFVISKSDSTYIISRETVAAIPPPYCSFRP